jgi:outer membrane protein assembly factor BamE (lipoprotein component of BamABCDE complex)
MQSFVKMFSVLCLCLFLGGCQAAVYGWSSDFEKVSVGMTKDQVIQAAGKPVSVSADADKGEEYFIYKKMQGPTAMWPRTYEVTFKRGHVVKYGEIEDINQGADRL